MTDLEKAIYLSNNVGNVIHFYHRLNGDSTVKIISVNPGKMTFEYSVDDSDNPLTLTFGEVVEFDFRINGIPPPLSK